MLDIEKQLEIFRKERLKNMSPEEREEFLKKENERYINKIMSEINLTPKQVEERKQKARER